MSKGIKFIAAVLGLVVILTGVFASMVFAAGPTNTQDLPACCQQQQGTSTVPSCCLQQGNPVTGLSQSGRASCCVR
jgi:hypothetical protein